MSTSNIAPSLHGSLSAIILTYNSEYVIGRTILAARQVADDIFVVDSGSTDGTVGIAAAAGCRLVTRSFANYADQRNWAIDETGSAFDWQLHLDADEILDDRAIFEIRKVIKEGGAVSAYRLKRRTYFLGTLLRFGGTTNWHLRLFRAGCARCEDRLYDQHFVSSGKSCTLAGSMHDLNVGSLREWIERHNRWSDLEAEEVDTRHLTAQSQILARLSEDPRERRRLYKQYYYRAPRFIRAVTLFCYRYFIQLGFLDGMPGLMYAFFQSLWFRMLVDAKIYERSLSRKRVLMESDTAARTGGK